MTLIKQQTEAWEAYVEARRLAEKTLKLADGFAAAKAWHAFLDVFLFEEDRVTPAGPNILRFPPPDKDAHQ